MNKKIKYLNEDLNLRTIVRMLLLVFVIGGIFGFVYEEIFYAIDLGHLVKRGTTWGPWIPIYGFGAMMIALVTYKLEDKPWAVFLTGGAVAGVLEFLTGYLCYHYAGGLRLWDYSNEIWNWGNIGGYICLRSVLFFAVSALILIYLILPFINYIRKKISDRLFTILSVTSGMLFFLDFLTADVLHWH